MQLGLINSTKKALLPHTLITNEEKKGTIKLNHSSHDFDKLDTARMPKWSIAISSMHHSLQHWNMVISSTIGYALERKKKIRENMRYEVEK